MLPDALMVKYGAPQPSILYRSADNSVDQRPDTESKFSAGGASLENGSSAEWLQAHPGGARETSTHAKAGISSKSKNLDRKEKGKNILGFYRMEILEKGALKAAEAGAPAPPQKKQKEVESTEETKPAAPSESTNIPTPDRQKKMTDEDEKQRRRIRERNSRRDRKRDQRQIWKRTIKRSHRLAPTESRPPEAKP